MSSSFNFPFPTTKDDDLEDLYKTYGVDRAVVLDLAGRMRLLRPFEKVTMEPIFLAFTHVVLSSRSRSPYLRFWRSLGYRLLKSSRTFLGILLPSWLGLGRKVFLSALVSSDSSFW